MNLLPRVNTSIDPNYDNDRTKPVAFWEQNKMYLVAYWDRENMLQDLVTISMSFSQEVSVFVHLCYQAWGILNNLDMCFAAIISI